MHDDLVLRGFTATKLNQLWLTDITEHWTDEGKLYLCAIKADLSHVSSVGSTRSSFGMWIDNGAQTYSRPGSVEYEMSSILGSCRLHDRVRT